MILQVLHLCIHYHMDDSGFISINIAPNVMHIPYRAILSWYLWLGYSSKSTPFNFFFFFFK